MKKISIIGIDLAKNLFQLHGAYQDGSVAFRKRVTRGKLLHFLGKQPPCLVAMEAVAGPTTGHGRSGSWATGYISCRPPMSSRSSSGTITTWRMRKPSRRRPRAQRCGSFR